MRLPRVGNVAEALARCARCSTAKESSGCTVAEVPAASSAAGWVQRTRAGHSAQVGKRCMSLTGRSRGPCHAKRQAVGAERKLEVCGHPQRMPVR
jgi:hypothetical protein